MLNKSFTQTMLANTRMGTLMIRWPEVCGYLNERRMACVGCPMAPFETVARVETIYGIPPGRLVQALLNHHRANALRPKNST